MTVEYIKANNSFDIDNDDDDDGISHDDTSHGRFSVQSLFYSHTQQKVWSRVIVICIYKAFLVVVLHVKRIGMTKEEKLQ